MVPYHSSNICINLLIHLQPIYLHFFCGWPAIFVCVICQYLLYFVGSAVIIIRLAVHLPLWDGLYIPYYKIWLACYHYQLKYLTIVHMCFRMFWNFHLAVFTQLFILHVPPPTSAFQQLRHIIPCFIPYFCMDCNQLILSISPMHIHHNLLLIHPLLVINVVFFISPGRNMVGCFMYLWHLIKGRINVNLTFFFRFIRCLLLYQSSYSFMDWYYLDYVRIRL